MERRTTGISKEKKRDRTAGEELLSEERKGRALRQKKQPEHSTLLQRRPLLSHGDSRSKHGRSETRTVWVPAGAAEEVGTRGQSTILAP